MTKQSFLDSLPAGNADINDGAPCAGMRRCGGLRKDGQTCGRWVFPPFDFCPWHRPRPSDEEIAAKESERRDRWRQSLLKKLTVAQAMEAACVPSAYPDEKAWKKARQDRRGWVRKVERKLETLGAESASSEKED